jgi:hypothetical protein
MTTLEDLKTIAKADSEEEKSPVEEKKAEEEAPKEEKKAEDKDEQEETNKAILEALKSIKETLKSHEEKIEKAMETPTDLPQSPKGNADSEDIGDDVSVPDKYQSNSVQAGLHDDTSSEKKPESDDGGLKMQEKAIASHVTSPVERPSGGMTDVSKSANQKEDLLSFQILQKCRSVGHENLSMVGKSLLDIAEKYDKEGVL